MSSMHPHPNRPIWPALILALTACHSTFSQGHPPAEAADKMTVPGGFQVGLVASEPMMAQPVCIEFDDRGRLWVIQYLQYPNPAGLERVNVDRYSRTVYDRVPEPPPRGPKGADRITILDDFDENGRARRAKDFVTGLNLASGLAFGHGGVFVLQAPYLLFYPDRDGDDVPDGDPQVLLTGFGMEDAHAVANSLTWGPDGWLYGCQGSTVTAKIRGIEFEQGIWRYHPATRRFELFCEGGGNSWGLDFDEDGNLIYSTNVGGYRMFHGVQGGYYWKNFGKHGPLHNPYTYGYFDHVPHDNFVGGPVTVGGIIYQGDSFPEQFRGKYIAADLLGHGVNWSHIDRVGSSFKSRHGGDLLVANDTWFAPSDVTLGPDGAIYVADWHDARTAHPDPDAEWDRSNGRIFRVAANEDLSQLTPAATRDLTKLSSAELVELLSSRNHWLVRKARRLLAEGRDVGIRPQLRGLVFETEDKQIALEALWALYGNGGCDEAYLNDLLAHPLPQVRRWAVRFLGDEPQVSPTTAEQLSRLAATEPDATVRSQLASTARRLPARNSLLIAQQIARRDLDLRDPHIPLLLWWAVEPHSVDGMKQTLDLFTAPAVRNSLLVRETILPRLMRRYATEGSSMTLIGCARLLEFAPSDKDKHTLLMAMERGVRERPSPGPARFDHLPPVLAQQVTAPWKRDTRDQTVIALLSRLGHEPARARALQLAMERRTPTPLRVTMLQLLGELAQTTTTGDILSLIHAREPEPVQIAALAALQQLPNAEIRGLLAGYPSMKPAVRAKYREAMLTRSRWTAALLNAVETGRFSPEEIPLEQIRLVALHNDPQLDALVRKHWGRISGGTPEEKLADIRRFNNDLRAAAGNPARGRDVFTKLCASCHRFFDEGQELGPDLTHANRKDKDYLLTSIVDPNAMIRREYLGVHVQTGDGRVLSGLVAAEEPNSVTLVTAENERITLSRDGIVSLKESPVSLMPEGLLHGIPPQELRDLFAYLQSEKPLAPAGGVSRTEPALERIRISRDGKGFAGASSGRKFVPVGFNYDRDYRMRLLEEYWDTEWATVARDFREMKRLGANVVRIHLQFPKFMERADTPNQRALEQLKRLLALAEETRLHLDLTGLGNYRKADVPAWYQALGERERWAAQATFWEAIARTCADSPAVFCYNLMNEPIVPEEKVEDWLVGQLAGFFYVEAITLDRAGRDRPSIARQWIARLTAPIQKHDRERLITVGLLPNSADEPGGSGFVPDAIVPQLDFLSVHIYPRSDRLNDDLETLKKFAVGKPLVIEEMFPMHCTAEELRQFVEKSKASASGWLGFYWGQTPDQLSASTNAAEVVTREWLKAFEQIRAASQR